MRATKKEQAVRSGRRQVARYFIRNGYIRVAHRSLRRSLGVAYKKGDELRIVLDSAQECREVRRLLIQAGIKPGKPFPKHDRIVQPVYGKKPVRKILGWVWGLLKTGRAARNTRLT